MSKISNIKNNNVEKNLSAIVSENLTKAKKSIKESMLEKNPAVDCLDFSLEESGIIMRKDAEGNVVRVIKTFFPR